MLEVFFRAVEDLDERRGRALRPLDPRPLKQHLEHLLGTDRRSCIVADERGRLTAFGVLMVRDGCAFLSFLFVAPGQAMLNSRFAVVYFPGIAILASVSLSSSR